MAAAAAAAALGSAALRMPPQKPPIPEHPPHKTLNPSNYVADQFPEKILRLEIVGVDSGKALAQNPALHAAPLHSVDAVISFLRSKGIHHKDLRKLVGMCPSVLTSSIPTDLEPVFGFLSGELGVPEVGFRRVINKCPRLLGCSVERQLRPALRYLRGLGVWGGAALAYRAPMLLAASVEGTLTPKVEYLRRLGLPAGAMVPRCPLLLTFSVERNLKPKFGYLRREMRRGAAEVGDFPQYFSFSLEGRIKPRHAEAARRRVGLPLNLLLTTTDEEFRRLMQPAPP